MDLDHLVQRKIRHKVTINNVCFLCITGAATGPLITGWVADDFVRIVHITITIYSLANEGP